MQTAVIATAITEVLELIQGQYMKITTLNGLIPILPKFIVNVHVR